MAVARQIKIFSSFKKKSSKLATTKKEVRNIANEYERIGEQKNPDINHNLSNQNVILKAFDEKEYDYYIENTDYNLNGKNSKYEDIYSTTPTIQATNFVNLGGINLTFLASKEEWTEFYKDVSSFIKTQMGSDFRVLSEVIQFDEFTPHLQLMGLYRTEISNDSLAKKDIENDEKLFEEISRKQFTRYNNKLKGSDLYNDPKNKKEYKLAKQKWIEEHREEIIKNYKPRNKTTEKKFAFIRENTIAAKNKSYNIYQNKLYEFCKEHKFIKDLCQKASELRGEKVEFVKNSTEPTWDGKSKDHYEIKETIERENKEIEQKIANKEELTENEMYRYIRKQNREKLKEEFLSLDEQAWKDKFNQEQKLNYNFNQKLANDYLAVGKEIANKEVENLINKKDRNLKINEELIEKNNSLKVEIKDNEDKLKEIKSSKDFNQFNRFEEITKTVKKKKSIFSSETTVELKENDYNDLIEMSKKNITVYNANIALAKQLKANKKENEELKERAKNYEALYQQHSLLEDKYNKLVSNLNEAFKYIEDVFLKNMPDLKQAFKSIIKIHTSDDNYYKKKDNLEKLENEFGINKEKDNSKSSDNPWVKFGKGDSNELER